MNNTNKTKWILYRDTREIKTLDEIYKGCVVDKVESEPMFIKEYDNKEQAISELKLDKYNTIVYDRNKPYSITEYYIEEIVVDNSDNFVELKDYYFNDIK